MKRILFKFLIYQIAGYILIFLFFTLFTGRSAAQKIDCSIQAIDDREIRIRNSDDIKSKRTEIIRAIWNADHIPGRSDVIVTSDVKSPLNPNNVVRRVDRFEIPAANTDSIQDLAYHFVPFHPNKSLVIYNPGHSCTLIDDEFHHYRNEATIIGLLESGFDVLAVFMPHVKESAGQACHFDHCRVINTDLGISNPLPTYGLRLFLEPTIVSLNYILKKYRYKRVDMVGLSGGGWTTNLTAAIDERISYSFNIAGSAPLFYRYGPSLGDVEQYIPELYRDITGYPDLYVLGAFGAGRKQVQIQNRHENCCFGLKQHRPGCDYDSDMSNFAKSVMERLKEMDQKDHYCLTIDETAPNHQISEYALNKIILPELKNRKN